MKAFIKKILPPSLYAWLRKQIVRPTKIYRPTWNTLSYSPLKNIKIYFDPSGLWQKKIMDNTYDTFLFSRLNDFDLQDTVAYDIGAHIGFHSLYFARRGSKVFAFEPNPHNVERFTMIKDANEDIKNKISIFPIAVSDKIGQETFTLNRDVESGRSSGSFIDRADTIWDKNVFTERGFVSTTVKTVPIDAFESTLSIPLPDILKIDVEGAEYLVLKGASHMFTKKRPLILIEVHSPKAMQDVMSFLESHSYKTEIIHEEVDGRKFIEAQPQ